MHWANFGMSSQTEEGPWGGATAPIVLPMDPPCRVLYTKFKYNAGTPKISMIPSHTSTYVSVAYPYGVEVEVQLQVRMFFRLG